MVDDHPTEAACLLEQGASYRRRIGLKPIATTGDPIFAGFKQGAFSLYFGDMPIYHFDLEGRWQRAFVKGTHYLKGLDATVHAIDRVRDGPNLVLKRRTLANAEADDLDARIRATARDLIADLDADRLGQVVPVSRKAQPLAINDLRNFLGRICSWDSAAWLAHRERYLTEYHALPFLPPECQSAVILQATVGNSAGVGFDGPAIDEAYTLSAIQFARHTKRVAKLWGQRLLQSHVIYLAGDDALHRPVEQVAAILSTIGQTFRIVPRARGEKAELFEAEDTPCFDGVHAFMDNFDLPRPNCAGWSALAERGLVRISLGVESGDLAIRKTYKKSWADDDLQATVAECKAAGLGVSLLTLVGAGGAERSGPHVESTVRMFESLEVGAGDFVFLLDERELGEPHSIDESITPLRGQAWLEQRAQLKEAFAPLKKRGVKVLPYTMEKQWT
jgi:hypothetical protein